MSHRLPVLALALAVVVLASLAACGSGDDAVRQDAPEISGRIEAGLRVLRFDPQATDQHFVIYRGDYVRPEIVGDHAAFTLEIPELEVSFEAPIGAGERPYFKVPDAGRFAFTLGEASGVIEAVEYQAGGYRELSAQDAAGLIANVDPFVLDVRTEGEFAAGHLADAKLIPVQQLEQRLGELDQLDHDRPVLVYCRSGNRSTVAARMLVDRGFQQVYNIRRGLKEWEAAGLPLER